MWGLQGDQPIPAIFCILEKNAEAVVIQAKIAKDQNMHRYVKIKMFGDFETDKKNISALRAFSGDVKRALPSSLHEAFSVSKWFW